MEILARKESFLSYIKNEPHRFFSNSREQADSIEYKVTRHFIGHFGAMISETLPLVWRAR